MDLVVLTETKIATEYYTPNRLGYNVVCTKARPGPLGGAQGGVALVYREAADDWHLESTRHHGPNCISAIVVTGDVRSPVVGVYLPPSSLDSLPDLDEALARFPGQKVSVLGDLNVDLMQPTNPRSHAVAAVLSSHGLEDMLPHFLQRSPFRHNTTYWQ